jgi:hypothetical protein
MSKWLGNFIPTTRAGVRVKASAIGLRNYKTCIFARFLEGYSTPGTRLDRPQPAGISRVSSLTASQFSGAHISSLRNMGIVASA